ncbi:MAG: hypothetical protein MK102_03250 [Fuerstiella sp.]|nr:hypothetical protein [Fuerstiella sp.]
MSRLIAMLCLCVGILLCTGCDPGMTESGSGTGGGNSDAAAPSGSD